MAWSLTDLCHLAKLDQYHKEEHVGFIQRMNSYFSRVVCGNYELVNEILEFLKQWLVRHIEGTDKKDIDALPGTALHKKLFNS
jgi:hemerythrin